MRVLIATDMEGTAGIDRVQQVFPGYPEDFQAGSRNLIADINACIRGLRRGGATEIKVVEGHAAGRFRAFASRDLEGAPEVLPGSRAYEALRGWPQTVALVGYHAMAGTPDGFLNHTVTGSTALHLNGEPVGEMVMTGASYGAGGAPVIMVTGDHATVREAAHFLPWTVRVQVKRATSVTDVTLIPREPASQKIEEGAAEAMARASRCTLLRLPEPVETEAHFRTPELADAAMALPMTRRVGERAVAFTAPTVVDALKFFRSAVQLMTPVREAAIRERVEALPEVRRIRHEWTGAWLGEWLGTPSPFTPNAKAMGG